MTNKLFSTQNNEYTVFTADTDPELIKFCKNIKGGFWFPESINYTFDSEQWNTKLTIVEKEYIKQILAFFASSDGLVNENICLSFMSNVKIPEVKLFYYYQMCQEAIHAEVYSNLITTFIKDRNEQDKMFDSINNHPIIKEKADWCKKWMGKKNTFFESLIAFLAVEGIFFSSSFASIFWLRDRGILANSLGVANEYISNDECLIQDTQLQVMNKGWVNIKDILLSDKVATFNMDNSKLEYQYPDRLISKQYTGDLYKFNTLKGELITTPNHDMVVHNKFKNKHIKVKAQDLSINVANRLPRISATNSNNKILTDIQRLAIAIQADGTLLRNGKDKVRGINGGKNYVINIKKQRKIDRLESILNRLVSTENAINFSYNSKFNLQTKFVNYYIYINTNYYFNQYTNLKQFDWVIDTYNNDNFTCTNWSKQFIEELIEWDGHKFKANVNCVLYSNTNKKCIDIAQIIGIHAGYETYISTIVDNRKESYKDCYKLSFLSRSSCNINNSIEILKIKTTDILNYDGNVYCVEVPNGTLITRYNDKTFITGNCSHAQFASHLAKTYSKYEANPITKETIKSIISEAVEIEKKFVDYILPEKLTGMNKDLMKQYVEYVADIWLNDLIDEKVFNATNPFPFMQTIGMSSKDNFFEKSRTNYTHETSVIDTDNYELDLED